MANQIQGTVYQIDGNPLSSPIQVAFLTSNIYIREFQIDLIPAVNAAIVYYPNTNNQLQEQTFLVSESASTLIAAANVNCTTQVSTTVLEINQEPQIPGGLNFSFPAQGISIWPVSVPVVGGVNSFLEFKNKKYYLLENEATLVAAANVCGGGGGGTSTGINGLNGTTNIGLGGTLLNDTNILGDNFLFNFYDFKSFLLFDISATAKLNLGATEVYFIYNGTGFRSSGNIQTVGDLTNSNLQFTVDCVNQLIYTNNGANISGIDFDFTNQVISVINFNSGIGLKLQADAQTFLGDYNNNTGNGIYFVINQSANEITNLDNTGTKFGFDINYSGNYIFGAVNSGNLTNIKINDIGQIISSEWLNNQTALYIDFLNGNFGLINNPAQQEGVWVNNINDAINKAVILGFGDSQQSVLFIKATELQTYYNGIGNGLKFDFNINFYSFGDYDMQQTGTSFFIDSNNGYIYTEVAGNKAGIFFDYQANQYFLGSYFQNSYFGIDSNNHKLLATNDIKATPSSVAPTLDYIKINIGGTDYLIPLYQ